MCDISVGEAYASTAGFLAIALYLALDLLCLLVENSKKRAGKKERIEQGESESAYLPVPGSKPWVKALPAIALCLSVLGASVAELVVLHESAGATRRSQSLLIDTIAKITCAGIALSWHVGWCLFPTARGVPRETVSSAFAGALCVGLGSILLWRAACSTAKGFHEFPRVQTLVFLEGVSVTGSIGALGACWSSWRRVHARTPGAHEQDHCSDTTQARTSTLSSAGWVSLLTFAWLNPLFEVGATRQLQPHDLPHLAEADETALWVERFGVIIDKERKRPRPSLVRACGALFAKEFLALGWLKAANMGIGFSGPLLLKVVVDAVQSGSSDRGDDGAQRIINGYLGAAGLAACYALSAILDTQFSLRLGRLQLHVRAAMASAVYRQALAVRSVDTTEHGLTTGTATNLIAVDAQRLMDAAGSLHELWGLPIQVGVTFYLLHREVSFAFVAGLCVIAAMIPLNTVLAKRIGAASGELMKHKDERVQRCSETLHGIRAVKVLAWEGYMRDRITISRNAEVSALSALKYVDAWCVFFWATTPTLVCLVTFATLVVVRGDGAAPLKVSSIFAAVSLLQMLIHPMNAFPWVINGVVEANVSKRRLEKLLLVQGSCQSVEEMPGEDGNNSSSDQDAVICWRGVTVSRRPASTHQGSPGEEAPVSSATEDGDILTPESLREPLLSHDGADHECPGGAGRNEDTGYRDCRPEFSLRNVDLDIRRGEAVAVVGEVGSGKSTLVAGILGELPAFARPLDNMVTCRRGWGGFRTGGGKTHRLARTVAGVRRETRVCYAAQSPWLMTGTVRDNVLFGLPMDEARYRETLRACALDEDLAILSGGDLAYVGERGATLSGGQRLRVSLARCAYNASAPYAHHQRGGKGNISNCSEPYPSVLCLLDDPLTSLDAQTRDHVAKNCIGRLLRQDPSTTVVVAWGEMPRNVDKNTSGVEDTVFQEPPQACMGSISRMFDRIVVLRDGSVAAAPAVLLTTAASEEAKGEASRSRSSGPVPTSTLSDATSVHGEPSLHPAPKKAVQLVGWTLDRVDDVSLRARDQTDVRLEGRGKCRSEIRTDSHGIEFTVADGAEELEYISEEPDNAQQRGCDGVDKTFMDRHIAIQEQNKKQDGGHGGPIEEEDRKDGSVELRVYLLYVRSAGVIIALGTLLSLGLMQATSAGYRYWLSFWATHQERVSVRLFLAWSFSIAALNAGFTLLRAFGFAYGGIKAAVVLHEQLLVHVLRKKSAFFDITPSGRIVNRFSRDAFSVDDPLAFHLNILLAQTAGLLATAVILSWTSPLLLILFLPLGVVYGRLQRYYRSTNRELRRLDSTSRSPIYAWFSETLDGAVTIRAFAREDMFFGRFVCLLADNQRATFAGSMASAWLSLSLQALGVVVITGVAFLAVAQHHLRRIRGGEPVDDNSTYDGLVGLSLTYALPIVGNLNGLLGALTDTEREMISVERMDEYCSSRRGRENASQEGMDTEASNEPEGAGDEEDSGLQDCGLNKRGNLVARGRTRSSREDLFAHWPESGRLEMAHVVMRYRAGLRPVLAGVSLTVEAGQKVGIVGRTGSGKSSLLKILFGLYDYEGDIVIDGIDVRMLPLQVLRSRLAVIPQEPLLFRGTIRDNLDPSGAHSDAALWQALRSCNLTSGGGVGTTFTPAARDAQRLPEAPSVERPDKYADDKKSRENGIIATFNLDTEVEGNGSNVSAGQRQLLCIARALVRRSRFVCIDEATSTVDAGTAEFVDTTMAAAFRESTVLTVAHRLSSVLNHCDTVAVMSNGNIIERGNPRDLAANNTSAFNALLRAEGGSTGDAS